MTSLFSLDALASLAALTFLEVVLSVDNLVFVALAASRLAPERRRAGRSLGLGLALVFRLLLLVGLWFVTRLEVPLGVAFGRPVTVKDVVLVLGGLFLLYKGSTEIRRLVEERTLAEAGREDGSGAAGGRPPAPFARVVLEIGVVNIVFSFDSVVTAVGMARSLLVMAAAVVIATGLMLLAARPVGAFIERRPTAKMLGFAFILLVGVALLADGTGFDVPRGYLYFAIAFSLLVEALNGARMPRRRRGRSAGTRGEP